MAGVIALGVQSLAGIASASGRSGPASDASISEVQITATRVPESVETLPASVTIISGDDLRNRGARDLRTALALVSGTDAPPGGDAGPASSVPSLWGLHEFDAFLLLVDGVPWGGAFNPALPTLDLHDVERIEVMKGSAPVMYGATSFVGVIHVIRYPAGMSDEQAQVGGGSYNSWNGAVSVTLPDIGAFRESLSVDGQRTRMSDPRAGVDGGHILYRSSMPVAGVQATLDAEYTDQTQLPTSPVIRQEAQLTTLTPLDGNFNPSDAGIGEHRLHLTTSLGRAQSWGEWHALLSYTRSTVHDVRGFLRPELAIGEDGNNADGFNQDRTIDDAYLDAYVAVPLATSLKATAGLDWLYGRGRQQSRNFAYIAALDGAVLPPASSALHIDEINGLDDRRSFGGLYLQLEWRPYDRLAVMAGARLNHTTERQASSHIDTIDASNDFQAVDSADHTRPSGSIGVSYIAWGGEGAAQQGTLFADYRDTFKPAAIDFGPDVNPQILQPETGKSYEAGMRLKTLGGRLAWEVAAFRLDLENLVVHQVDQNGAPILANAGNERFEGVESEIRWSFAADTSVMASYSYHDARFGNTISTEGGTTAQLSGHQLELSPHNLAALGLQFAPVRGPQAAVQLAYIGRRFLDRLNTAPTGGYTTLDARLAYRFARGTFSLNGYNLTDRRAPVTGSEFGDESYYLLPARRVMFEVSYNL
jgi:outer membrane receptor protein involved in Fe transport